jgi:UMF1 family MFS transporter
VTRLYTRAPVLAWATYDWANSGFTTTVMAGFFPMFFKQFWSLGTEPTVSTFRLGVANAIAGLAVALLAPLLGAIADRGGARKRFLIIWSLIGIAATAGLHFVQRGEWAAAAALFVTATAGYMGANVFNDALMLDVAQESELDRVSAFGFALGYLGGGLLFAFNVLMLSKPSWFGLAGAAAAVQLSFLFVAAWWFLFMLPLAFYVHERRSGPKLAVASAIRAGLRELGSTIRHVAQFREVVLFLIAYWLYIDAVNTIVKMAVDYGLALGLPASSLLLALLLTQFVAFPAALGFGWIGGRLGAKRGILIGLCVYTLATCYAYFLNSVREFFALAVVIGLVQGGVQSLSRSLFGRLVPQGKSAEFFGFYNMMGKFATVLGPLLIGVTALLTGSSRGAIVSLVLLFVVGGVMLLGVPERRAAARP